MTGNENIALATQTVISDESAVTQPMTTDEKADLAINSMVAAVILTAAIPAHVNWAFTAGAMGSGVVAIGICYGVKLNKDEAWQLIKQFVSAAGFWFVGMGIGTKFVSALLTSTGIGHIGAVAIDAAVSSAFAYAIGACAKAYFKGTKKNEDLKHIFREKFNAAKQKAEQQKENQ